MHHLSSSSTIKSIFQLFSNFLSKMVETGVLKTYTFLYCENYCAERNYGDVMNAIEDLKNILLKICSELTVSGKDICEPDTFSLLTSNSISSCISRSSDSAFTNHNNEYALYSTNAIHDTIEQNIQFMTNSNSTMCNSLNDNGSMCSSLREDIEFASTDLTNSNLKQNGPNISFNECDRMNEHVGHALSFPSYKNGLNSSQNEVMLNVHESSHKPDNLGYQKNDTVKIDLESNISLNGMHQNCNDSLYNTLKEAISGDFLQSMKFSPADTHDPPMERNISFNEQYPQCEPSLQSIDLDILSNTNERINHALDRIFDDQFTENDALLESECWNVDINLPSTDPIQSNIDLQTSEFELSTCPQNLKQGTIRNGLSSSLVTNFENSSTTNLEQAVSADIENSLQSLSNTISHNMGDSMSTALTTINQEKYNNNFENDKYFCEHCGFICNTKLKLKIHLKRQHNVFINSVSKCDQCGKSFKNRHILRIHMRIHRNIKPFECHCCWKAFSQKITLDSHLQTHTGMYKFPCSICPKRFTTQAKLNFHSKSHEKPEWKCDVCSKMFTTKQYLNVHKKSHNKITRLPEKCFSCMKCHTLFEKNSELLQHIKEAHPDIMFMCRYVGCNRNYPTYKKLRDHIYKKHTVSKSLLKKGLQNFECETCRISFVEKSSYHRHNLLVHCEKINFENSFDCMHCDKRFTTESSLDDHLEKFHSASLPKDMDYSCSICGSLFYKENALKEHMNIHSDFGTHLCSTCGAVFSQKSDYLVHQSEHDSKKQNISSLKKCKCETCDEQFDSKMELKQHELDIHNIIPSLEELKPYSCSVCGKRFTAKGKCNLHMQTHSGNRRYRCTKCNKRFFRPDVLKEHMNSHTGYRAHVCQICGLGFSQKSSLKTHEVTHDHKKTLTCDQCGKIFQSKQALNFHMKIHEGNFKYTCDVCSKKFVRKCHYELHILCHSNERPFKCIKCPMTYKTSKHLREHSKKAHLNDANFGSLLDSIYTDDDTITQQSLLDEYIPSINPLDPELMFSKT